MEEVWKDVVDYENTYEVSSLGNIRNKKTNTLKRFNSKNYQQIKLCGILGNKLIPLHKLVALHFIPNPEGKHYVNHIDHNKSNNQVSNLEWVTPSENIKAWHKFRKENPKKEDEPIGWSFPMPKDVDKIIFDYQTELRKQESKHLNKFQILFKIVKEWKQKK